MSDKNILRVSRAKLLEKLVKFEGGRLSYDEFFFWKFFWALEEILTRQRRIGITRYVLGGRQISKSTTLSGECVTGLHIPNNRMLYIAPQSSQTKVFSTQRLGDMLESPMVHKNLFTRKSPLIPKELREVKQKVSDDIFTKRTVLGSYLNLTYTDGTDTGRIRGFSADTGLGDECQSMTDLVAVHHVARYCLRSSRNPRFLNVGTSFGDDDFSKAAEASMFFIWNVKCEGCNTEQDLRELGNIDIKRRMVICRSCGKPLNVPAGHYVATNPDAPNLGIHANMLMLPSLQDPYNPTWEVIRDVILDEGKSDAEKKEELLGVPGGAGEGLISKGLLNGLPRVPYMIPGPYEALKAIPDYGDGIIVGIDWGGDSDPDQPQKPEDFLNSHTSVTVTGIRQNPNGNGRTIQSILWGKTFPIEDPNVSLEGIFEILKILGPKLGGVATDFGGGFFPNPKVSNFLNKNFPGVHFVKVQLLHMFTPVYEVCPGHILKVQKLSAVTEYFRKFKMQELELVGENDSALPNFYRGALSQRQYVDKSGTRFWKKRGKVSDDEFMGGLFAYLLGLNALDMTHEILKNALKHS